MQSPSETIPEPPVNPDPEQSPDGVDSEFDHEDTHWCQDCSQLSYDSDGDDDGIFGIGYPQFGWHGEFDIDDEADLDDEEELDEDDDYAEEVEYVLHHNHFHHHGNPDLGIW
jgi:hypothetical protein